MIKRWFALLMALAVLMTCGVSPAEEEGLTEADLQETLTSEGKIGVGSLAENLQFLKDILADEEIRSLLTLEDVQSITTEIVGRVLLWLYRNRDVTMKILTELGVSEADQQCIAKLWDSADRISEAGRAYSESEKGKQLSEAANDMLADPDMLESWENFRTMVSSADISLIVNTIVDTAREGAAQEHPDSAMAEEAIARQLDRSSFIGSLTIKLFYELEKTEWFSISVPKLIRNEHLWKWLILFADRNNEMNRILQEEINLLASDPEMIAFVDRTLQQAVALMQALKPVLEETQEETLEETVSVEDTVNKEETP